MAQALIGIDPRIRARRAEVRRAEGRRRLRFLIGGVGFVAAVIGVWGITRTPLLDLDHVRVEGVVGGSVEEIDVAAGLTTGAPLLDLDLAAITQRVEALPWVETAAVRRDWPGTVRIEVVERVPVARIPGPDGAMALVDAQGVVTAVVDTTEVASLPLVDVALEVEAGAAQASLLPALEVVTRLPADLAPWIRRVVVDTSATDAAGTVRLALDLTGSATAKLGDATLLADKLQAIRAVLAGADLDCVATIDVSVADLTTVTRDAVCDGSATPSDG